MNMIIVLKAKISKEKPQWILLEIMGILLEIMGLGRYESPWVVKIYFALIFNSSN